MRSACSHIGLRVGARALAARIRLTKIGIVSTSNNITLTLVHANTLPVMMESCASRNPSVPTSWCRSMARRNMAPGISLVSSVAPEARRCCSSASSPGGCSRVSHQGSSVVASPLNSRNDFRSLALHSTGSSSASTSRHTRRGSGLRDGQTQSIRGRRLLRERCRRIRSSVYRVRPRRDHSLAAGSRLVFWAAFRGLHLYTGRSSGLSAMSRTDAQGQPSSASADHGPRKQLQRTA